MVALVTSAVILLCKLVSAAARVAASALIAAVKLILAAFKLPASTLVLLILVAVSVFRLACTPASAAWARLRSRLMSVLS